MLVHPAYPEASPSPDPSECSTPSPDPLATLGTWRESPQGSYHLLTNVNKTDRSDGRSVL